MVKALKQFLTVVVALVCAVFVFGPRLGSVAQPSSLNVGAVPQPSTQTPPATDVGSTTGSSEQYARADHTHATSVQRTRRQVTGTNQVITWVFAKPFDPGVTPVITCTPQNDVGATLPLEVNVSGTPTNTSVDLSVFKAKVQVVTIGISLNLFGAAPVGAWVNCQAARPTQ